MLQHLLNTSAIWLLSLVLFDIFLRKETYHGYNRAYLLTTFIIGLALPFWSWSDASVIEATGMSRPVERTEVVRQTIIDAGTTTASTNWLQWLLIAYLFGIATGFVFLLRDVAVILSYYKTGKRSKDGVWTVIETNKEHSPFSAFRWVFITSKDNYTASQLRTVLTHEQHHGHALHFIDLLVMQLAKVLLWFHPLVYMFNNRLLMVHEYQADAAVEKQPEQYGRFLVEQAMLRSAPVLSHSFNRSPIKNRIIMLTRKTSGFAKGKQLVMAPLLLACVLFFTQRGFSQDARKEGNKIYYKGNVFELWGPATNDTIMIQDPVSGEWILKIAKADSLPVKMNGQYVYREDELSRPEKEQATKTRVAIQEFIIREMQAAFERLDDGTYIMNVNNVIIDEQGKIVFYNRPFVMNNADPNALSERQTKEIVDRFKATLNTNNKFEPIVRSGKPVIFNIASLYDYVDNLIVIRDHKRQK